MLCFVILQSMHWAVRTKKEPMLEAAKVDALGASHPDDLHFQQGAPETPLYEERPSSSKSICQVS